MNRGMRRRELRQKARRHTPPPVVSKENDENRKFFKRILGAVIIICTILAGIASIDPVIEFFKSRRTKFEDKNIITGEVKSPKISGNVEFKNDPEKDTTKFYYNDSAYTYPILNGIYIKDLSKKPYLFVRLGGQVVDVSTEELYKGVNFFSRGYNFGNCLGTDLYFAAKNDRLYVSCKFMDLKNELAVGEMAYNHWKIYDGRFLDYFCTDESFEVIDHQNYVLFSISYEGGKGEPYVSVAGYLMNPYGCTVIGRVTDCFEKSDSGWKAKAAKEIYKIKPVVKSRCD